MNEPADYDGFEQVLSRYIVGIDLGTTNCAVAFIDTQAAQSTDIENFPIEQWVDFGVSQRRELLPSFLYQPLPDEAAAIKSPNHVAADHVSESRIVGSLARDRGLQLPGRQVSSAKSWLCHDGVDRRSAILPWQSDDEVDKISPVEASAEILAHICRMWDRAHRAHPLAQQDIVLTLPASFDQVARQLTIEAAAAAGLKRILPIEEPQAAFYAWLARHADSWEQQVAVGQTILVCDIGGGTTDFTLIRVRSAVEPNDSTSEPAVNFSNVASTETPAETSTETSTETPAETLAETLDKKHRGKLSLHRVAVGQHLILGGDNIDLALARMAEQKLTGGGALPVRSWDVLRQACRVAKETLLGNTAPPATTMHLPSSSSRLIGGGRQVEVTQAEVRSCVLDGFFPLCGLSARPEVQKVGFQEFGLPFAKDPAITKHLASFLWEHRWDGRDDDQRECMDDLAAARPDWILFNGGVMTSTQLRERIVTAIAQWFAGSSGIASDDWMPGVLDGERLDLAVARGAAYFGGVRRGNGVEIEAKLACSYYLQTSVDPPQAICIVPGSASPGEKYALRDLAMVLATGQPVQFPVLYSSTRLADRVGQTLAIDTEQFTYLPPLRTVIETSSSRRQGSLPVYVEVELSQIGTLQMYCHATDSDQRWKLEFDVRGSTQTDHELRELAANAHGANTQGTNTLGTLDEQTASVARRVLTQVFSGNGEVKPAQLMTSLADQLSLRKSDWPSSLLRAMWGSLMDLQEGRRKTPEHEARWLNLLGYALRPGYGLAADDWRVAQTWRSVHGKLNFASASSRNESLILWRRIAGGFTAGQQLTVYQQVAGPLRSVLDPARRNKGATTVSPQEFIELLRLVGSLELLPKSEKSLLGDWLIELLPVKKWAPARGAVLWTLGRLGSRVPVYGPLNCVVDAARVEEWLRRLNMLVLTETELPLAMMQCGRRVHDRYRDISDDDREMVVARLRDVSAPAHWIELVREGGKLASDEANQVMGEDLPLGLTLGS